MVFDLEGSVRLPHSDERDPFRALQLLVPSRLEGRWGVVDRKAGGLADARHIFGNETLSDIRVDRCERHTDVIDKIKVKCQGNMQRQEAVRCM